jgi:hypothetical protein
VLYVDEFGLHALNDVNRLVIGKRVDLSEIESLLVGVLHTVHLIVVSLKYTLGCKTTVKERDVLVTNRDKVDGGPESLNDLRVAHSNYYN